MKIHNEIKKAIFSRAKAIYVSKKVIILGLR